jgi:hypothetical protein
MFIWMVRATRYYDIDLCGFLIYCKFQLFVFVISKKLIASCSFSIVNFMDDCNLLNSLNVCSTFVLFWLYIMSTSSAYLKYVIICCFFRIGYCGIFSQSKNCGARETALASEQL